MRLPKSINPCPIREAVAEVRFESSVPADAVFGIAYQSLKNDFPEVNVLPITAIPADIRNADRDFAFQPHYMLRADAWTVLVGPKVISVGMRKVYPGWAVLSQRIKATLHQLHGTGIVKRAVRLGLRYISFFAFDIYPQLLLRITVNNESWDGEETLFKTVLCSHGCKNLLQIGKGLALVDKPGETGSIIDIDSFTTETEGEFGRVLERFLEGAHLSEKELFFTLLKPDFLATLNPVYENEN
ncbi:MAG: TIGR04255 family protein [Limisphaerales bacterium]